MLTGIIGMIMRWVPHRLPADPWLSQRMALPAQQWQPWLAWQLPLALPSWVAACEAQRHQAHSMSAQDGIGMASQYMKQESSPAPGARPGRRGATSATPLETRRPAAAPDTVGSPRAPWAASRGIIYARLQSCLQTGTAWHGDRKQLHVLLAERASAAAAKGRLQRNHGHMSQARRPPRCGR